MNCSGMSQGSLSWVLDRPDGFDRYRAWPVVSGSLIDINLLGVSHLVGKKLDNC